jgi:hypothetical protein
MQPSRRFAYYTCEHPVFVVLVEAAMTGYHLGISGVKNEDVSIRQNAVSYLLSAMASEGPNGLSVSISRAKDFWFVGRYPKGHIKALKLLLAGGWCHEVTCATKRKSERDSDDKRLGPKAATYGLTAKSWEVLGYDFDTANFKREPSAALIVSGNSDKGKIKLNVDDAKLKDFRNDLTNYNLALEQFGFTIEGVTLPWDRFELNRVFNSQDLLSGGRFYSDFVLMSGSTRSTLTIDDEHVIQADFNAIHARLGLAITGRAIVGDDDPYQIDGQDRNAVKQVFTVLFNSKTGRSNDVDKSLKDKGHNPRSIRALIFDRFPELKALVKETIGLKLQRADSEVVSILLRGFTSAGRPLVTVHDGFYLLKRDKGLFYSLLTEAIDSLWSVVQQTWPEVIKVDLPLKWSESFR